MPRIDRLRISGLRNLSGVDLRLPEGSIWLVGDNGAGKTSVLEAVYLLSRGVSFRGRRFGPVVARGAAGVRLDGWMSDGSERWRRSWSFGGRGGQESAGRGFRVRLIGASMQMLLEGEPGLRRRFLDWNLFHVEHRFDALRLRYRRVTAQRNAWLKAGGRGLAIWDAEYAKVLAEMSGLRSGFFDLLRDAFRVVAKDFDVALDLRPEWRPGLPEAPNILPWLKDHLAADVNRGYSFLSLARGDFHFQRDGNPWVGSRGQNKLVGVLLQLAAEKVVSDRVESRAIWLVDDLGAELDLNSHRRALGTIMRFSDQTLVTSLTPPSTETSHIGAATMFHVEHGQVLAR